MMPSNDENRCTVALALAQIRERNVILATWISPDLSVTCRPPRFGWPTSWRKDCVPDGGD